MKQPILRNPQVIKFINSFLQGEELRIKVEIYKKVSQMLITVLLGPNRVEGIELGGILKALKRVNLMIGLKIIQLAIQSSFIHHKNNFS